MIRRLVDRVTRSLPLPPDAAARAKLLLDTEWLVTNGLGGYASGTAAGVITRRYHGMLVAALPNPLGRTVMLNHLTDRIVLEGEDRERGAYLSGEERAGGKLDSGIVDRLEAVRLEVGLPIWNYVHQGVRIEKRIVMPAKQNTVHVQYALIDGADRLTLELHPAVHFRGYEERVDVPSNTPATTRYSMSVAGSVHHLMVPGADLPPLRFHIVSEKHRFVSEPRVTSEFVYPVEESRGYEFRGTLWTPGRFEIQLEHGKPVTLVASTESEEVMLALDPDEVCACERERRRRLVSAAAPAAQDETGAELVLAADQFIITPAGRLIDATRAAAMGQEIRTIIAGYHWFTDWGRDTMISLEGLTLVTGRTREAGFILRTFGHYVRDGLIPNLFPNGSNEGLYHTADASLWFFHAVERYVQCSGDQETLLHLLPILADIVDWHIRGTRFGIRVDPNDGLITEGAAGYQLTWMDAKVGDWVVTPRMGKAVEINALWYNALRLLERWQCELRGIESARGIRERADHAYESFNRRFWIAERGYLYDVVDGEKGDSAECRPNQIFAISLDYPVLDPALWKSVLDVVKDKLLTPVGLRSLSPDDPEYKPHYFGDLRSRDAAYHQGTVWAWLIGPWIDAWLKVHPEDAVGARRYLDGCIAALGEFGLGTIGEVFDATAPYSPRGCIAQAWSVAEVLRCWVKTSPLANAQASVTASGNRSAASRERFAMADKRSS